MGWEENEQKKDFLRSYQRAKRREQLIEQQIQKLRADKMFPSMQGYDDMPKGSSQSDLSNYIVKLDELINDLKKEKEEAIKRYMNVRKIIHQVKDELEQEVLERRYINGEKWEDIASNMDYDYTYVHKIHAKALKNIDMR